MHLPKAISRRINKQEAVLIRKDLKELWKNMVVRAMLVVVPLILVILIPILFMVLANLLPQASVQDMDRMRSLLTKGQHYMNNRQALFSVFSSCLGPMLYLIVPLMTACVTAASSFVGEKERGTMETLFLTPLTAREIFNAKVLGSVGLSALASLISFLLYAIVMSVGDVLLGVTAFWLDPSWLVMVLCLAPALIVFGALFMVLVSGRSHSFMESVQICGYVLLPLVLLYIIQFSGLLHLNAGSYFLISLLLAAVDTVIWRITSTHFTPEKLLR